MHLPRRQASVSETSTGTVTNAERMGAPCYSKHTSERTPKQEKKHQRPIKVAASSGTQKVTAYQKLRPVQASGNTAEEHMIALTESLKLNFGARPSLLGWTCELKEERTGKVRPVWFPPNDRRPLHSKRQVAFVLGLVPSISSLPASATKYTHKAAPTVSHVEKSEQRKHACGHGFGHTSSTSCHTINSKPPEPHPKMRKMSITPEELRERNRNRLERSKICAAATHSKQTEEVTRMRDVTMAETGSSAGTKEARCGPRIASAGITKAMGGLGLDNNSQYVRMSNTYGAAASTCPDVARSQLSDREIMQEANRIVQQHNGSRIVTLPEGMSQLIETIQKSTCEIFQYWELSSGAVVTVQGHL